MNNNSWLDKAINKLAGSVLTEQAAPNEATQLMSKWLEVYLAFQHKRGNRGTPKKLKFKKEKNVPQSYYDNLKVEAAIGVHPKYRNRRSEWNSTIYKQYEADRKKLLA
jgi:hypothetical protein